MDHQNVQENRGFLGRLRAGAPARVEDETEASTSTLRAIFGSPYLALVSRLVLGAALAVIGLAKLGVPDRLAEEIMAYQMPLPQQAADFLAVGLPPLMLALGVWLIAGLFTRLSAALSGGLVLLFLVALGQAMLRGLEPACSCSVTGDEANPLGTAILSALGPVGGILADDTFSPGVFARDFTFLLLSAYIFFVPSAWALDNLRRRRNDAVADDYGDDVDYVDDAAESSPVLTS